MAMIKSIPVFISSPNDVPAERRAVQSAVRSLEPVIANRMGAALHPVSWKTLTAIASRDGTSPQDQLLEHIRRDSIFVSIMHKRYGEEIPPENLSGTHTEIRFALEHRNRIKVLSYFRNQGSINPHEVYQANRVQEVKNELKEKNVIYKEYGKPSEFNDRIIIDILDAVYELIEDQNSRNKQHLIEFFRLGLEFQNTPPSVQIVCPQIHKHESGSVQSHHNWQERLLPNVVFEDFKAIQKIQWTLREIGVRNCHALPPALLKERFRGNRIWLCLPRNSMAQNQLARLGSRVHFKVDRPNQLIEWKAPDGSVIKVVSPLEKYLKKRRPNPQSREGWKTEFGYMYGVDYAILSRFKLDGAGSDPSYPFYHYYIAGIRGLGTWGAGWYIEERAAQLSKASKDNGDEDLQLLLKVTYLDYEIIDVENVSNKAQWFFDEESSQENVDAMYREHYREG